MKKVKAVLLFPIIVSLVLLLALPKTAWAAWKDWCVHGVSTADPEVATIQGLECLFALFLQYAIRLAGIAAFIMILAGGFQYLTSGDNPENTQKAWGTITWGVGGLVILLLVWLILQFIKTFTNIDVTQFLIPGP